MTHIPEKYRLLGCPCIAIDSADAGRQIVIDLVNKKASGYSVAINAEKLSLYRRDARVSAAVENASLPFPDGAAAVIALKWLYGRKSVKFDLTAAALQAANLNAWRVFVLGSQEEVNKAASDVIRHRYPRIQVVGRLNGFESEEVIVDSLRRASPQVVLVGLGSPKQELLAYRVKSQLPDMFLIGCGGALDILAGRATRAPKFMINHNVEWLYRLWKQPWRWRRQLSLATVFAELAREKLRLR